MKTKCIFSEENPFYGPICVGKTSFIRLRYIKLQSKFSIDFIPNIHLQNEICFILPIMYLETQIKHLIEHCNYVYLHQPYNTKHLIDIIIIIASNIIMNHIGKPLDTFLGHTFMLIAYV